MTQPHLEFLVEEFSMEICLQNILPKMINAKATFSIHSFQGKKDLLNNLLKRLRGYASWLPSNYRIFVVVDRDDQDCITLKKQLEQIISNSGLVSCSQNRTSWQVVNRIAIEELEAWYFGDVDAICSAYPRVPLTLGKKPKYRIPDAIAGGTWEALERELKKAGYFKTGLRKVEAARTISMCMNPLLNRSHSFQVFQNILTELISPT